MAAARQRTEEAIASGCHRCRDCGGDGGVLMGRVCNCCGGAGFIVPEGGMPLPRSKAAISRAQEAQGAV